MASKMVTPLHKRHVIVSDTEFEKMTRNYRNGVKVTDEEAEKMQISLGPTPLPIKAEHYLVGFDVRCRGCSKQLTFYDIFQKAVGVHGAAFMKAALFGPKMIGGYEKGTQHQLPCATCAQLNLIVCDDYYLCQNYGCI